jgi:hypothetical protein
MKGRALPVLNRASTVFLWAVALLLVLAWGRCVSDAWYEGRQVFAFFSAFTVPLGLFLLFWLEGLEAAYGELHDKELGQVDPDIREVLDQMQRHNELFIGQRELFVVVGILVISFLTDFDLSFEIPFLHLPKITITRIFGLIFTSLIVFWFASVASKKLAVRNPQVFLRYSSVLWPLIRKPSWVGYLAPADNVVQYFSSRKPFSEIRILGPSRSTYYEQSCRRYGYSSDRIQWTIVIHESGGCTITQKGLLWMVEGSKEDYGGEISLDAQITQSRFLFARILSGPRWLGDNSKQVFSALDALFESAVDQNFETAVDTDLKSSIREVGIGFVARTPTKELGPPNAKQVSMNIKSPIWLPEGLKNQPPGGVTIDGSQGALLLYCIEHQGDANAFKLNAELDSWSQRLTLPCRVYEVGLAMENSNGPLKWQFAAPKVSIILDKTENTYELVRAKPTIEHGEHVLKLKLMYTLPGSEISLSWRCNSL